MRLEFNGVVSSGDKCRCGSYGDDMDNGAVYIGDVDVVDEIAEQKFGPVSVFLNGERIASGSCVADLGWGYSSWTPIDSDTLSIDGFDLIAALEAKDGQEVSLIVTDEE